MAKIIDTGIALTCFCNCICNPDYIALAYSHSFNCISHSIILSIKTIFTGFVNELKGKEFSAMTIMVFDQNRSDSYINYKWQWEEPNAPA